MNTITNKIQALATKLEQDTIKRLKVENLACEANILNARTKVKEGKKYTKVDIGGSGRLMVENSTGNIYGVKAYGVIHRGHFYGTLDTIEDWFWGTYYPTKWENTGVAYLTFDRDEVKA